MATARPDGAFGRIGTGQRIVEEHHQPVAGEAVERALEGLDERHEDVA
jgi:hypothetical protein